MKIQAENTKFLIVICNISLYFICLSLSKENQYNYSALGVEIAIIASAFLLIYDYFQLRSKKTVIQNEDLDIQLNLKSEYQKIYKNKKTKAKIEELVLAKDKFNNSFLNTIPDNDLLQNQNLKRSVKFDFINEI